MELAKSFDPADIEAFWRTEWEKRGYYTATTDADKPAFSIQLPPPNVTGTLHMGHAFNQTIMDGLTRYHRMRGYNTAWIPGTDHAGIATQIVVERQLDAQKVSRHDLGREKFVEKVWEWKEKSGSTITGQMRRMGASTDWTREYFTMDDKLSKTVTEVFVRLYEQGLIYRGKRLVNWDPVLGTAVSDLEVASEEEDGFMWYIHYPLADGSGNLTVATTRPETLLGDVAVAVAPERRTLSASGRQDVEAAAVGPRNPDHRRRLCRQGIRHRLREDHAGARLQRLCSRPTPQAARRSACSRWTRRSAMPRLPPTRDWTASSRASKSSPTWTRRACWPKSSRTN